MKIVSIRHRGLKRLILDEDARELRPDQLNRIENIVAALLAANGMKNVTGPPGWRIHELTGDRAGMWSISVSGNWRLTFRVDGDEIRDLNLEDYH